MNRDIIWQRNLECTPQNLEQNLHTIPKTDLQKLVIQSMGNLSDKQKIYLQKYLGGYNMPDIAEEFGVNISSVHRGIHRAVKNVMRYLDRVYVIRIGEE